MAALFLREKTPFTLDPAFENPIINPFFGYKPINLRELAKPPTIIVKRSNLDISSEATALL